MKRLIAAISGLCLLATSAVGFYQSRDSNYNISISGGGGGGFSLVSHTSAVNSATTPGINTTGANLIVIFTTRESSAPTDSLGNTWTPITNLTEGNSIGALYYKFNPTTGAAQTFTSSGTNGTIEVQAWSGASVGLDPGLHSAAGSTTSSATVQPGSLTPSGNNELLVSGASLAGGSTYSVNSSFTISDANNFTGGSTFGGAMGYFVQSTAAAVNPTWSVSAAQADQMAAMAVFK